MKVKGYFLWLLLVIVLASCKQENIFNPNTFKYNQAAGISTLDPAFSKDIASMWACSHIYESLFILDSNAQLAKLLIDSFWVEKDQLSYHFIIKKNIYFHKDLCFKSPLQTRKLNAYDVEYSLKRLIDNKTASPGSWVLKNKLDSIQPFQIKDSHHITINLKRPNAQFIHVLSMPYSSIVPEEAVIFYGRKFRKNPVGTGPFQFKLWDDGTVLFLEKNKNYHQLDKNGTRLPYLDFVKISFNENKKIELISFKKNQLSFITGLDQTMIQELFTQQGQLLPEWKDKAQVSLKPFLNTEYFAIQMQDSLSPLKYKKIRQAINYAINRPELVQYLKYNLVTPATKGFVAIGMPNYDTAFSGYSFQPEKAKKLIKEIYPKNEPIQLELHINNTFVEMAELIASQLDQVGIKVEIKLHPADMMMQLAVNGSINFFRRSWMADYSDAENYFACFYSKNSCPPNYTRFTNAKFDQLYEEITIESSLNLRKKKYLQMEKIILEETPIVPLFYDQSIRMIQNNIIGLEQNVVNTLDLRRVKIY